MRDANGIRRWSVDPPVTESYVKCLQVLFSKYFVLFYLISPCCFTVFFLPPPLLSFSRLNVFFVIQKLFYFLSYPLFTVLCAHHARFEPHLVRPADAP